MKRTLLGRLSILLVFILFVNTSLLYATNKRIATVQLVDGTVFIKKSGGEKKIKAIKGMNLSEGDTIITEANGNATVILDDDKTIQIAPNTVINIKDLGGTKGNETTTINQPKGVTVTKIDNKLVGNSTYNQKTPTSIMGVKGTIYGDEQVSDRTIFSIIDGMTSVQSTGSSQPILLLPGSQLVVSNEQSGKPSPIDLSTINPFVTKVYNDYRDALPPELAKQIADYVEAHPEVFAPSAPSAVLPSPQINYNTPASNTGGGTPNTSSSGGGTPIIPPIIPSVTTPSVVTPSSINLTSPLNYNAVRVSEYLSTNYISANSLIDLADMYAENPLSSKEIHLRNDHLYQIPGCTAFINYGYSVPEELFSLSPYITMQFNEYLGQTSDGNHHWKKITAPLPTYSADGIMNLKKSIINGTLTSSSNSSFQLEAKISLFLPSGRTAPCKITQKRATAATNSEFTIDQHFGIGFKLDDFSNTSWTVDGVPLTISNPSDPASIIAAFNAASLKASYDLELWNLSNTAKQIGIDLTLQPVSTASFPVPPSYLENRGFKASLEDVAEFSGSSYSILNDLKNRLPLSIFRALAPLNLGSVRLDNLNLLSWNYSSNNSLKPINSRIIYTGN